mmetsp:Transcript_20915/g.35668  ORF Transcript_20915/g.35668 Transcript_20915/m.35668 type:complete len:233 (-) Transcript_20915:56-754(-)
MKHTSIIHQPPQEQRRRRRLERSGGNGRQQGQGQEQGREQWQWYTIITQDDECEWFDHLRCKERPIQCDNEDINIEVLNLPSLELRGTIPPELSLLSESIKVIWLPDNMLSGTIPSEMGLLTKLRWLDLSSNRLVGSIPPALSNLQNSDITWVDVSGNNLTGSLQCPHFNDDDSGGGGGIVGTSRSQDLASMDRHILCQNDFVCCYNNRGDRNWEKNWCENGERERERSREF